MSNFESVTNNELLAVEGGNKLLVELVKIIGGVVVEKALPAVVAPLKMIEQYRR